MFVKEVMQFICFFYRVKQQDKSCFTLIFHFTEKFSHKSYLHIEEPRMLDSQPCSFMSMWTSVMTLVSLSALSGI